MRMDKLREPEVANRRLEKILWKMSLASAGDIYCGICRINRGENKRPINRRSWKLHRDKQYKPKDI